jgi:hypothetical protein
MATYPQEPPQTYTFRALDHTPELVIPLTASAVRVDARLDQPLYATPPLLDRFVVAGEPHRTPPATRAWLFWQPERLIFAFDCDDADVVAAPPSDNKKDVDFHDRGEVFLWSGRRDEPYYCLEIGARGALHDFRAHFYRRFDDTWSLAGLEFATALTPRGYSIAGAIPRAALARMGFRLEPGARWRIGLFRAEFSSRGHTGCPADAGPPTWLTWVDAQTPQPDFHVAAAFGWCTLRSATSKPGS